MHPAREIAFEVLRAGAPIGRHSLDFQEVDDQLHVEIAIDLEVKFAFLTLFRYRHRNHEVWQNGHLVALDTTTDDDGQSFHVRGRATETGFWVESSEGDYLAPADIVPTSYWNPETLSQSRLLDTQRGQLLDVSVQPLGEETVDLGGRLVAGRSYRMSGDLELDLWYTADGEWARIAFMARGAQVNYARRRPATGPASALEPVNEP